MMRRMIVVALALAIAMVVIACGESEPEGPPTFAAYPEMGIDPKRPYSVIVTTDVGRMTFILLPAEAPLAVNSFTFLLNEGFYTGMEFYRVLPGVLAETGDPTGTGTGGPGYTYELEPPQRPYARGLLAMAPNGADSSNGSRFYILLGDLDASDAVSGDHTIFGHLKEDHAPSQTTLTKIENSQEPVAIREVKAIEGCLPNVSMWTQGC